MAARKIERAIQEALTGDAREQALDFVTFLRENEVPTAEGETYWDIQLQGKSLCFLWIDGAAQMPGPWTIWSDQDTGTWFSWTEEGPGAENADFPEDERTKQAAWAHVNPCASCGDCAPGRDKTVLGKPFENLCNSTLAFTNPDSEALACAKKMVLARKADILNSI